MQSLRWYCAKGCPHARPTDVGCRSLTDGMKVVTKPASLLLVWALLASACAPRVVLPQAISTAESIELRRAQYERYRPTQHTLTVNRVGGYFGPNGYSPPIETTYAQVRLASGDLVLDPEDLLPLVGRESRTRAHVLSARSFETGGVILLSSMGPLAIIGTGFLFGGGALRWTMNTTLWVSIPMLVVAGLAGITGGILRAFAGDERRQAFGTFDDDFRDRLGLCVGPIERGECSPNRPTLNETMFRMPLSSTSVFGLSLHF